MTVLPTPGSRLPATRGGAAGALLLTMLAGCANYHGISSDKHLEPPAQFASELSVPAQGGRWPSVDWASAFGDPQLTSLINEALANSPSIAEAQARVQQASAFTENARSNLFPKLNASYSVNRELYSGNALYPPPYGGSWYTENNVLARASYELDLWGKNSSQLSQSISQRNAVQAQAQESRLMLASSVAHAYNELAREYALRDVISREIAQRESVGSITADRISAGLDTQVEVQTSNANIATNRSNIDMIDGRIQATRYQLGALLGQGPDRGLSIAVPQLAGDYDVSLPDSLPANLVSRRPDIVAARWTVDATLAGVKVAKAEFYPDINLSAAFGFDAFGFGRFLQFTSRQVQAGPAINLPIFDAGALRAQLKGRYAEFDIAVAQYNNTLASALGDVATQVSAIRSTERQLVNARAAYDAAQKAYELAVIRYRGGLTTQLQVLSADQIRLSQEQSVVQLGMDRRDQQISLIKALGGGFDAQAVGLTPSEKADARAYGAVGTPAAGHAAAAAGPTEATAAAASPTPTSN
ncbi:MAG: efflux transporter outer membrane subunit [Janthinobacterium lividum]